MFTALGWKALKYAFCGFNASIFAYGQTGSGKSHSMIGTETDPGMIRRIGDFLFDFIARGEEELGYSYTATVSAAEIYCENVRDLLTFMRPGQSAEHAMGGSKKPPKRTTSLSKAGASFFSSGASKAERMKMELSAGSGSDIQENLNGKESLKIREGKDGVYVEGQTKIEVRSMAEMGGIIFAAIENRMVRATSMNADSSRSHLIFVIEFTQTQVSKTTGRQTVTKSKINLVDLAGSERARTTGVSGDGLREGANINKSLSTLGRVISALADGGSSAHGERWYLTSSEAPLPPALSCAPGVFDITHVQTLSASHHVFQCRTATRSSPTSSRTRWAATRRRRCSPPLAPRR